MHRLLFWTSDMATFDSVAVKAGYATFDDVGEQSQTVTIPYPVTIDGKEIALGHTFTFLASTIKGWTLPRDVEVSVPLQVNGSGGNRIMDFTVDNLNTFKKKRESWISFTVNGVRYEARDSGGKQIVPASDVRIRDNDGNGYIFANKKGDYSDEANPVPPVHIPGFFIGMDLYGKAYENDLIAKPADKTIFGMSKLAKAFKDNGTAKTYKGTITLDDGTTEAYNLTYYEQDFSGEKIAVIDPETLPEIIADPGKSDGRAWGWLRGLTSRVIEQEAPLEAQKA